MPRPKGPLLDDAEKLWDIEVLLLVLEDGTKVLACGLAKPESDLFCHAPLGGEHGCEEVVVGPHGLDEPGEPGVRALERPVWRRAGGELRGVACDRGGDVSLDKGVNHVRVCAVLMIFPRIMKIDPKS